MEEGGGSEGGRPGVLIKGCAAIITGAPAAEDMQDFRLEDFMVILPQSTGVNNFL